MDRFNSIGIDDFDTMVHPEELLEYEEWLDEMMEMDEEEIQKLKEGE